MVPVVLTDINKDGIEDMIVSSFNSTVYAFDGKTFSIIWQYSFADSESVSAIVPGHYDRDNVTDFLIKYNTGPGFPVYYYSQTQILNGFDGKPLLEQTINDSGGPNGYLAGTSISQTFGGDFFLHWQTQCRGKSNVKEAYRFFPGSDVLHQSRADTCMLRYNSSTVLKLYAITRHIQEPGAVIFSSDDLLLQLNQTNLEQFEKQIVSPVKHPKLSRKLFNKEQAAIKNRTTKISTSSVIGNKPAEQQSNQNEEGDLKVKSMNNFVPLNVAGGGVKTIKNRKKVLNKNNVNQNLAADVVNEAVDMNADKSIYNLNPMVMAKPALPIPPRSQVNDLDEALNEEIVSERQKEIKDFINANRDRLSLIYGGDRDQDAAEQQNNIDEYEGYDPNYNQGQYSNNRDIRSKQGFGELLFCCPIFFLHTNYLFNIKNIIKSQMI